MMTLDVDALSSSLRDLFAGTDRAAGYPTTDDDAATRWAAIYADYAADAIAVATAPVATAVTAARDVLATALQTGFHHALAAAAPRYPTLVSAMASAFTAFWPAVPFQSPEGVPVVLGVAVSPLPDQLSSDLTQFFAAGNPASGSPPSGDSQAASLAAILHDWTQTVRVTNTTATGTTTTVPLA